VVKRSVLLAFISLGVLAPGAFAAEYSVTSNLSERLSGSSNYFLSDTPIGSTFKSETNAGLTFGARTLDTRLLLSGNISYFDYFGSGAAATSPQSGFTPGVRLAVDHKDELNKYKFEASWDRAEVAVTQFTESGIVTSPGFLDNYRIGGGVLHDVSPTDSIGLSAHANTVRYSDNATLTPYTDVVTEGIWTHLISPTTSLNTTASFDWYNANNPADSQRYFWQIMIGLQTQLSQRLSVYGSIGAGYSDTRQNANVPSSPTATTTFQPGTASSVQGYIGLSYRLSQRTRAWLTAFQGLVPTTYGALQTTSSVGGGLSRRINDVSRLQVITQYAHEDSSGFITDLYWAQVRYEYDLTPALSADLSFTYRQRNDNVSGYKQAGIGLLTLNYDYTLLGNPSAHDKNDADAERRRLRAIATQAFPGFP
jgi:hypothetical protein